MIKENRYSEQKTTTGIETQTVLEDVTSERRDIKNFITTE